MSAPDKNWPRWVFASFATWFRTKLAPLPVFIEGEDRDTSKLTDFCEFRLNGPSIKQVTQSEFEITCQVNVLIQSTKDNRDAYKIQKNIGLVAAAFATSIPVFKYGDGGDDDQSQIDCMVLRTNRNMLLDVANFGQVETDLPVLQSVVEGSYYGNFTN